MIPGLPPRQFLYSLERHGIVTPNNPIVIPGEGFFSRPKIPLNEYPILRLSSKIQLLGECHSTWVHQAIAIFIVVTTKYKVMSKGSRFMAVESFLNDPSSQFELVTTDINLDETTHGIKMLYDHIRKKVTKVGLSELDYSILDTLFTWCSQLCRREEREGTNLAITLNATIDRLLSDDINYSVIPPISHDHITTGLFRFSGSAHIQLPTSREEAEAMILIANKWLEGHPQSEKVLNENLSVKMNSNL